ncbi:hypothetical protein FRB90_000371 [Tulasnella sp. 427]|nr:hypothetical protein FRB90_000371 [Tulasnella sp. 427]
MDTVALDVSALVLIQTSLAFITAPFTSPTYNFPLFLFGVYASENKESNEPLRLFSALVGLSVLFDFIWLLRHDYNGLIGFVVVIAMIGKIPTFYSILIALRHRGLAFGSVLGRGGDDPIAGNANTVWAMPGGFGGGKPGYQNIDQDLETAPGAPSQPPPPPPTNLPGPSPVSHQATVPRA